MQAVIARYTGVLAAADVPTFTTSTSTSIAQSVRLDLGTGSQVTRDGNEMAPDSSGRVAIVVRAGGELGRATAQELAAAGFTVIGVDRNEDGPKELPDGIRYEAGDATTRPWPGASSTGSLLRSDRPACWSTPEARITPGRGANTAQRASARVAQIRVRFRFRAGEERRGDGVCPALRRRGSV